MKVIWLVGPIASGKGTVAKILAEMGYSPYSLSDRIREETTLRGFETTRQTLTDIGNELRQTLSADVWAKRTAELIEKASPEFVVIDAIRNPAELTFLKQKFGAKIIGIVADQKKRFEMFKSRGKNTAGINTWEEFKAIDDQESSQEGSYKQQVDACLALADIIIENNETIEDLKQKIENFLNTN